MYNSLFGHRGSLGFNLQALSRLSWFDIGDYFSTLLSELGLVGQNDKNNSIEISSISSLLTPYEYGKVNIITDNELSEIPGKYNADAITIGSNIIFRKDKFNAHSPQGIALLVHELTHI